MSPETFHFLFPQHESGNLSPRPKEEARSNAAVVAAAASDAFCNIDRRADARPGPPSSVRFGIAAGSSSRPNTVWRRVTQTLERAKSCFFGEMTTFLPFLLRWKRVSAALGLRVRVEVCHNNSGSTLQTAAAI